ncbi:hypothetical protein GWI33_019776 [Rhynchophorus ferrugineus]|uniref:Uncharacterized protein n=1 Tax=Rhynchophorus ferrugineus TaxID=354439 RepID=A0A834M3Y4_RHYFE|nr:hypothetical protein GWI33_019776 [Rhynchophorus ferrugineus]
MDKKEFCVLIKYCFLKGKNTVEANTWLDVEFPDSVQGKLTIKDWQKKSTQKTLSSCRRSAGGTTNALEDAGAMEQCLRAVSFTALPSLCHLLLLI